MSMLLEAVHRMNVPRAAALLLRGADVNTTDAQGVTPLIIACERGELRMVDLLLEARASTKMVTNHTQSSCLHIAAKNNAAEIVRRLLKADPSIEERATSQGDTALMVACLSAVETEASAATLTALLQPKRTSSPSNDGTAHFPTKKPVGGGGNTASGGRSSSDSCKASLTALGPDDPRLIARNRHGHTALHCAAFSQSPTAVRLLLEAGADCTIGDKAGRTAVEVALNLNKKKTMALTEGARGGSAPAAECLRLLKERWAELEDEAKERQRVLLGELEGGAGGEQGDSSNSGSSGATGSKKSTRKKRKKQLQQQQQIEGATSAGDADTAQVGDGVCDNAEAAAQEVAPTVVAAVADTRFIADVGNTPSTSASKQHAAVATASDRFNTAKRNNGATNGNNASSSRNSSDSEGETDDEAGSHPSSEAETGSHEGDAADRIATATAAAAVLASLAEAEEAAAATAAPAEPMSPTFRRQDEVISAPPAPHADGGREREVGEAWSVVARPARKKKTALTPPLSSRPSSAPLWAIGASGRIRALRNHPPGFAASRNRSTEYPALPGRERESRVAKGPTTAVAEASGVSPTTRNIGPPSEAWVPHAATSEASLSIAIAETAVAAAAAPPPPEPASDDARGDATATDAAPTALVAAVPPYSIVPADASVPAAVKAAAEVVDAGEEESPVLRAGAGSGLAGGDNEKHGSFARRQLNVNASAWQPPTPPPPPLQYPLQQLQQPMQQHISMHQQQMHMYPSSSPPPPRFAAGTPMGVVGGHGHPPPPPPLAPWGQEHQAFGGNSVNFGHNGFAAMPPQAGPPMHIPPGSNSVTGGPSSGMMVLPHLPPYVSNGVMIDLGAAGSVGPSISDGSPMHSGVADGAQSMLEASSSQVSALALRVEHLVWGMEAMSTGLSMGQLDALKVILLDQVARVDEAKLEQVRAQERSKSEEQTSILNHLQHFQQADSAAAGDGHVEGDGPSATDEGGEKSSSTDAVEAVGEGDGATEVVSNDHGGEHAVELELVQGLARVTVAVR